MMKKRRYIGLLLLMLIITMSIIAACGKDSDKENEKEIPIVVPADFTYFRETTYASHLFVVKAAGLTDDELLMVSSLQGILAQTSGEIYVEEAKDLAFIDADEDGVIDSQKSNHWLYDLKKNYGKTFEYWTQGIDELVLKYKDKLANNGFILCSTDYHKAMNLRRGDNSVNVATTIAGVEKWLIVPQSLKTRAVNDWGLTQSIDVTDMNENNYNKEWVFATYKDRLINDIVFHLNPIRPHGRDFAIALKALTYYGRAEDEPEYGLDIYEWAQDDLPYLGWGENEVTYVALNSQFGAMTISIDWSYNVSLTNSLGDKNLKFTQKYDKVKQKPTPQDGKHYLALFMTDGDNPTWLQGGFINDNRFYGNENRGNFKMTWGMSPSIVDIMPNVMNKIYSTATPNDVFISGASGTGYINPSTYLAFNDAARNGFKLNAARTNHYFGRTDLEVIDIIDSGVDRTSLQILANQSNIKGGTIKYGNKYKGGGGAVYWFNDKPFVTVRESCWQESPINVAARVNSFAKNYKSIEGYSVLTTHCWSTDMNSVQALVDNLDPNVELVTVPELIQMVTENVPHKDVTEIPFDNSKVDYPNLPDHKIDYKAFENASAEVIPSAGAEYDFNEGTNDFIAKLPVIDKGVFDGAKHRADVGIGVDKGCLYLDGSDFGKPDATLNSYFFKKVTLPEKNGIWLNYNVASQGSSNDANSLARVFYKENDEWKVKALSSWILTQGSVWSQYSFDISEFKGKTVVITLEQDDSGEGSGEAIFYDNVSIGDKAAMQENTIIEGITKEAFDAQSKSNIAEAARFNDWKIKLINPDAEKSNRIALMQMGVTFSSKSNANNIVQALMFQKMSFNHSIVNNITLKFATKQNAGAKVRVRFIKDDKTTVILLKDFVKVSGDNDTVVITSEELRDISFNTGLFVIELSGDGETADASVELSKLTVNFNISEPTKLIHNDITKAQINNVKPSLKTEFNAYPGSDKAKDWGEWLVGGVKSDFDGLIGPNDWGFRMALRDGNGIKNDDKSDKYIYNVVTVPALADSVYVIARGGNKEEWDFKARVSIVKMSDYSVTSSEWVVHLGSTETKFTLNVSDFKNELVAIFVEIDNNGSDSALTDKGDDIYVSKLAFSSNEIHNGLSMLELTNMTLSEKSDFNSYSAPNLSKDWGEWIKGGVVSSNEGVNIPMDIGYRMFIGDGNGIKNDNIADKFIYNKLTVPTGSTEIIALVRGVNNAARDTKVRISIVKMSSSKVVSGQWHIISGLNVSEIKIDVNALIGEQIVVFLEIDNNGFGHKLPDGVIVSASGEDICVSRLYIANSFEYNGISLATMNAMKASESYEFSGAASEMWQSFVYGNTFGGNINAANKVDAFGLRMFLEGGKGAVDDNGDIFVYNKFKVGLKTNLEVAVRPGATAGRQTTAKVTIIDIVAMSSSSSERVVLYTEMEDTTYPKIVMDLTNYANKDIIIFVELCTDGASGSVAPNNVAGEDMFITNFALK